MFFQMMFYVGLVIGFVWLGWRLVIRDILKSKGIEVDEPKMIKTKHTKNLEEIKEEYVEKLVSAKSAQESKLLSKKIKQLDCMIKECEEAMIGKK